MIKLTHDNYYTKENKCLSNSKVSAFLKSKEYYYRRYISGEITTEDTAPIKIGKLVDAALSGLPAPYIIKVLKKDDPEEFERQKTVDEKSFCTKEQFDEAAARAAAVMKEPFYKWYKKNNATFRVYLQNENKKEPSYKWYKKNKSTFQVILQNEIEGIPVCGMADIITETPNAIYIDDFKSVSPMKVKSPTHWFWNCRDMGYFRQAGAYRLMYQLTHGFNPNCPVICRHVVVTKEMDNLYRVHLYILPEDQVAQGEREFVSGVKELAKTKKFSDPPLTWDVAIEIGAGPKVETADDGGWEVV